MCLGVPLPPYIKEQGEEVGRPYRRAKKEVGREKERGAPPPPPSPSPIRTRGEEARGPPWLLLSLSTKAHTAHYFSGGGGFR